MHYYFLICSSIHVEGINWNKKLKMTARIIASCLCVRESSTWSQTRSLATTTCTACRFNVGRRSRRQVSRENAEHTPLHHHHV